MRLSKPMLCTFLQIARGINTIEKLAEIQHKSINWIVEIIQQLEKESFVIKKSSYKMNGSRILIEAANTNHAIKLKELIFQYPTIKFEDILSDSRLLFLAALCEDWMNTKTVVKLSKISKYMIDRYRPILKNRGIIIQQNDLYKINEKAWLPLKDFLIAYKNYSMIKGIVRWKYQDEIIFEVDSKNLINGSITGFTKYSEHGIKINLISILCKIPETNLSREEIFVHSLFEINDPRTLYLALTFYLKNSLAYKRVLSIAMKYGKYTIFSNMVSLLKSKEDKIKLEKIPQFERADFRRTANMYGVKNV